MINSVKIFGQYDFNKRSGTKYSRMDQVKFVEDSLWKFEEVWFFTIFEVF